MEASPSRLSPEPPCFQVWIGSRDRRQGSFAVGIRSSLLLGRPCQHCSRAATAFIPASLMRI